MPAITLNGSVEVELSDANTFLIIEMFMFVFLIKFVSSDYVSIVWQTNWWNNLGFLISMFKIFE